MLLRELDEHWMGEKPYVYTSEHEKAIEMRIIMIEKKIDVFLWLPENRYQLVLFPYKNSIL